MTYKVLDIKVDYARAGAEHNSDYQPQLQAYVLDRTAEYNIIQKRPAVIICPGGGYGYVSNREAEPIAMRFLSAGINAFVLRYSAAPARFPCSLLELATAVELVRQNAEKWHVDKNRVVVCGFSAGGHLAASLGVFWDNNTLFESLVSKNKEYKPNGLILAYPVITSGQFAHTGSLENLIGNLKDRQRVDSVSLEHFVSRSTPPTFLWHTQADPVVPVENSILFTMALRQNKIPFELHIYEKGGHGLGLADDTTAIFPHQNVPDCAGWADLAIKWMKRL